ncbi:MAG: RluA family pseudouridine synthase [Candidatus Marinimicrobia bacterium]|nr:RluA family pseudouridine synthase [Candidatus Neomarinimicrobiota bacterium]
MSKNQNLKIIYEDNHLLVVCKPPGILIQGDVTGDITLLSIAKEYLKEKYQKQGNVYIGLVHRLDRPASGVVVFARTSKAAECLMKQFQQRQTRKIYQCLVTGQVPESGTWSDRIERREVNSFIVKGEANAELSFRCLDYKNTISLVEVDLRTGKHHQIRVQFAQRGFPVIGDFRYVSKIKFPERAIALHARSLSIIHPTLKEEMTFSCEQEAGWDDFLLQTYKAGRSL